MQVESLRGKSYSDDMAQRLAFPATTEFRVPLPQTPTHLFLATNNLGGAEAEGVKTVIAVALE